MIILHHFSRNITPKGQKALVTGLSDILNKFINWLKKRKLNKNVNREEGNY